MILFKISQYPKIESYGSEPNCERVLWNEECLIRCIAPFILCHLSCNEFVTLVTSQVTFVKTTRIFTRGLLYVKLKS